MSPFFLYFSVSLSLSLFKGQGVVFPLRGPAKGGWQRLQWPPIQALHPGDIKARRCLMSGALHVKPAAGTEARGQQPVEYIPHGRLPELRREVLWFSGSSQLHLPRAPASPSTS